MGKGYASGVTKNQDGCERSVGCGNSGQGVTMLMKGEGDFVGGSRLIFWLGNVVGVRRRERRRRRGEGQASEGNWQVVARSSVGEFLSGRE